MKKWSISVIILAAFVLLLAAFLLAKSGSNDSIVKVVKVGYFPNMQHAQAVVGVSRGDFQKALGEDVEIKTMIFNAGPSLIEALFAGEIDIGYVGPNPAVNGYVKSNGEALKIIAGAASGGASFIVRSDSGIKSDADLEGKTFASPQIGNTQDVALKYYIKSRGIKLKEEGGTTKVIQTENPNILTLFLKKDIDGAWVPEPWGSRLIKEGNGTVFVDERDLWENGDFTTAVVIVNAEFLEKNPEIVKKWVSTHVDVTKWINENKDEAKTIINQQIKILTGKEIPLDILDSSFSRMKITYDPLEKSTEKMTDSAYGLGYLGETKPGISGLHDLSILNSVLEEKELEKIK